MGPRLTDGLHPHRFAASKVFLNIAGHGDLAHSAPEVLHLFCVVFGRATAREGLLASL